MKVIDLKIVAALVIGLLVVTGCGDAEIEDPGGDGTSTPDVVDSSGTDGVGSDVSTGVACARPTWTR
jgi:hypothetical protein